MEAGSSRRPFLVTLVGVVTIISATVQLIAGVILLVLRAEVLRSTPSYTQTELTVFAIAALVSGAIYLAVGLGILRLSALALGLGVVVSVLAIAGALYALTVNQGDHETVVISLIANVIVLVAMISGFSARARSRAH